MIGKNYQPRLSNSDLYYESLVLPEHFEGLLHISKTKAARPNEPQPRFDFGAVLKNITKTKGEAVGSQARDTRGVVVQAVFPGSLAWRCGLQIGDRIIRLGEEQTSTKAELSRVLAAIDRPGSVPMTVIRETETSHSQATEQELDLYLTVPPWLND